MIEEQLLVLLRSRANGRRIVPISESALQNESGLSLDAIKTSVDKLARAGLLEVLAPFPFLVVKLRSWSSSTRKATDSASPAYSHSSSSSNRLKDSYRHSDQALMREILDTLGETDPTSFQGAITNFSAEVIRKALERVRRARSLRKNRTALFRYLLTKLS